MPHACALRLNPSRREDYHHSLPHTTAALGDKGSCEATEPAAKVSDFTRDLAATNP
jgi:hypothetical protein